MIQHDNVYENFEIFDSINQKKILNDEKQHDIQIYDLESSYDNYCLSLWQPWAALVVNGIKRFEGRQWSTNYRGPLWIHSGNNPYSKTDIDLTKKFYQ